MSMVEKYKRIGFTRRSFLGGLAAAGVVSAIQPSILNSKIFGKRAKYDTDIVIFSKHLQWLDYDGMAETAAEIGFDGVALTVRRRGHVLPERAEEDIPKAAEACKKAGIKLPMIVTGINKADANAEKILKTASKLGVTHYRMGYLRYNEKDAIPKQLEEFKAIIKDIAAMNREYKIYGGNQNHGGRTYLGTSIWDQWLVYKDVDPEWIGFQYDFAHSVRAGIMGSWQIDLRLIKDRIGFLALKTAKEWDNPEWKKSTEWEWERKWFVPTVYDWKWYMEFLSKMKFSGPMSLHYEFPGLGGAEQGRSKLEGITKKEFVAIFRRKLEYVKGMLKENGII